MDLEGTPNFHRKERRGAKLILKHANGEKQGIIDDAGGSLHGP
jgi:hypothetical protein